jgi:hypothetical protein
MAKYYSISREQITIKPLAFLAPIGFALIVMLLLLPITTLLIMMKGHLQDIEPKYFAWYIILLPFLLGCTAFFTYSRRQIIFDAGQQTIYIKSVFGQKALMAFNQVASIQWVMRFGIAYYLKSKGDRYGTGYRISPSFSKEQDKDKIEFDSVVLPAIWRILGTQTTPLTGETTDTSNVLFDAGQMAYYKPHPDGYALTPMGINRYLPVLLIFGAFACYSWFHLLTKPVLSDSDKQLSILLIIPVLACLLTVTKKMVFDITAQKIKLYRLGFVVATYPISTFAGFNIVRKTYNGLYNGTDVRLKFLKPGSKQERELTLADFGKTNPIEGFITETEYILARMARG